MRCIQLALQVKKPLYKWVVLALMGALLFVVQVALSLLPNVELVTAIIIVITTCFGWSSLVSVYIFVILEIIYYGFGIWNVKYLYMWAILVVIIMLTHKFANSIINAVIAAFYGLFFGTLCAIPYFFTLGAGGAIAWIISGIPYDIIHCVANFILVYFSFSPMLSALKKVIKF